METTRWTSRKFWTCSVCQLINVGLLALGKLPVDACVSLTYLLVGGYLVGNVTQKVLLKTDD